MASRLLEARTATAPMVVHGGSMWGAYTPAIGSTDTQREAIDGSLEPTEHPDGSLTFTLPIRGDAGSVSKRRIERLWTVDDRTCTHTRGDRVVFEGEFMGVLGAAAASGNQWHVLWQLHGPGGSDLGAWRPPPLGLKIQSGRIQLSGGEGHPNNQFVRENYYGWAWDCGPWADNVRHRLRVEVLVGNDPNGRVTVVFDGQILCEDWRPQGNWPLSGGGWQPNYPGTIFSQPSDYQGDWLQSRAGLYRGHQNGEAPPTSYAQWVRWWPISLSQAHLGPQPA